MSKSDEQNPDTPASPRGPSFGLGASAQTEVARDADATEEWDLGLMPIPDGPMVKDSDVDPEAGAAEAVARDAGRFDTLPSVDVSVFSAEVGAAPQGPELPPLVETPTAPLPLEEAEEVSTGEIELAEVDELVDGVERVNDAPVTTGAAPQSIHDQAESVSDEVEFVDDVTTPPPVPLEAQASRQAVVPPLPVVPVAPSTDPASETWAEPLAARPRRKRTKPWYEEVFDEDYLRTLPFMTAEQTLREVNFIKASLAPAEGSEVLDVACGYGRHSIELAQRGLRVTGIDLSLPLLIRAADESQRRSLSVNFVHADMREMSFDSQFDGACCMMTSFGYFDEETNLKVASGVFRALKPGGRFLLDAINRDYIVGDLPTRVWWEGDGCVVLEEVDFNFHTSRVSVRRSIVFQDGRQIEQDISIRAYSLHELGRLLKQAGFRVSEVSGSLATRGHFFGATSRNLFVLCEKPR
ncbi:MAG: class I SAM-dependent methyltransferase [Myxococcales bacterium]|nr:class I SAM-dependent methyltransferase [Myxococcales bacterium]